MYGVTFSAGTLIEEGTAILEIPTTNNTIDSNTKITMLTIGRDGLLQTVSNVPISITGAPEGENITLSPMSISTSTDATNVMVTGRAFDSDQPVTISADGITDVVVNDSEINGGVFTATVMIPPQMDSKTITITATQDGSLSTAMLYITDMDDGGISNLELSPRTVGDPSTLSFDFDLIASDLKMMFEVHELGSNGAMVALTQGEKMASATFTGGMATISAMDMKEKDFDADDMVMAKITGLTNPIRPFTDKKVITVTQGGYQERTAIASVMAMADMAAVTSLMLSDNETGAKGVEMTFKLSPVNDVADDDSKVKVMLGDGFSGLKPADVTVMLNGLPVGMVMPVMGETNAFYIAAHTNPMYNIMANDTVDVTIPGLTNPKMAGSVTAVTVSQMGAAETVVTVPLMAPPTPEPTPVVMAPGLVQNLNVEVESQSQLFVSWDPPADNGGSDITGYEVKYWKATESQPKDGKSADQTFMSISGLDAGTRYRVSVAAENSEHTGTATVKTAMTLAAPAASTEPKGPESIKINGMKPDAKGAVGAGADVSIDIVGMANVIIHGGDDIDVTLPDFGIPGTIDASNVIVRTTRSIHPAEVSVSGSKITLTLPTTIGDSEVPYSIPMGKYYEVIFKDSAGLTAPAYAGMETVKVSDNDTAGDSHEVTIKQTVSVDPSFVPEGDMVTLTAKGLVDGAVSVHLGTETSHPILVSGTASDGVAELEFEATDAFKVGVTAATKEADAKGLNMVTVFDANAIGVGEATVGIEPKVELGATNASRSGKLEITVSDWYYGSIKMVKIGGVEVAETEGTKSVGGGTNSTFTVTVPANVRLGEQKVELTGSTMNQQGKFDDADKVSRKVTINTFTLSVNPGAAVVDQVIRIEGSGFGDRSCVKTITVGGKNITENSTGSKHVGTGADCVQADSDGDVAGSFRVPLGLEPGTHRVKLFDAGNRIGEADLVIPEPTITLEPASGQRGDTLTVVGSNFPSVDPVTIRYAGVIRAVATTDTVGAWRSTFQVPLTAAIGKTHDVVAQSAEKADGTPHPVLDAKAKHEVPDEMLSVSPDRVAPGQRLTINASNLPLYTPVTVRIGDIVAAGKAIGEDDASDAFGNYQRIILVPQLAAGTHTVEMTVHSSTGDDMVATFVELADIVTRQTDEVFEDLITAGQLKVVWRYNNADQSWASYDPTAPAELNDLNLVSTGDIVWIELAADATFQGDSLKAGWSLIPLE